MLPRSTLPIVAILSFVSISTLVSSCYIVVQSRKEAAHLSGRRLRHYPSAERFTNPSRPASKLPNRIRFARNVLPVYLKRRRRTAVRGTHRRYSFGIVPFTLDSTLSARQRDVIERTMEVFENYTCIRFVNHTLQDGRLARDAYRLAHNGYIEFVNSVDCFCTAVGNIRAKTRVSCCSASECLRLLGKALGQRVEHQSFRRDGYLRVNPESIPQGRRGRYLKALEWEVLDQFPVDLSSPMNQKRDYGSNGSSPVTVLTPELIVKSMSRQAALYYFFQEISVTHQCHANNCSHFKDRCLHDGYVTLVGGRCACRCPDGLDPSTACATVAPPLSGAGGNDSCGSRVYHLTEDNPSVSFSSRGQGPNTTCTWLISVPDGNAVLLNFDDFDVAQTYGGRCKDRLEIRHGRIGQRGKDHCGRENPKPVTSYYNMAMLRLVTSERSLSASPSAQGSLMEGSFPDSAVSSTSPSSFAVTARLVSRTNLCYNPKDKGFTYAGTVDYASDYSPCVPWWRVTHCPHHPYKFQEMTSNLDGNYCRNPGNGVKPWCYTNPNGCQRRYCDVCMLEKPHNTVSDCHRRVKSPDYCTRDKQMARATCAEECQRHLFSVQPSVADVTCGMPEVPSDGVLVEKLKNRTRFSVGDFLTFRCRHVNRLYRTTIRKYCLSTGRWSQANSACLPCHLHKGWVMHGESCYTVKIGKKSADDHHMKCRRHGGDLADISSWEEQKFVSHLVFSKGVRKYFIAANDMMTEGKFYSRNFDSVEWTNWSPESINGRGIDCVAVDVEGVWHHELCRRKFQAVCKAPILRHRRIMGNLCIDFRDDCRRMLVLDSRMCEREGGMFAVTQCARTCEAC